MVLLGKLMDSWNEDGEQDPLKRWMQRKNKPKNTEARRVAEAVIFAAWPQTESDRKVLKMFIEGRKVRYKTKRGVKRVSYDGRGEWLKNAFMVPLQAAQEVEALLQRRGIKYKKWEVVVTESGPVEQPLTKTEKNEILKQHVEQVVETLKAKFDVDSREEALMQLFYRLRLSEYSPRQADSYGRMRNYVIKHELFPQSWKQATSKLKKHYGVNNSLLALALLLREIGYLDIDPRKI